MTTSGQAGCLKMRMRPTKLGSWGRYIKHVAMNCRFFSWTQPPHPSVGWISHQWWPRHNCWQTCMTSWGTADETSYLVPCMGSFNEWICMWIWLISSRIAWSTNGISHSHCPRKSYAGWTKVAGHSLDEASTWWVHYHWTKMETFNSLSL